MTRRPRLPRWYGPANRRRGELIFRDVDGTITPAEREELAVLEGRCRAAVDAAYPRDGSKLDEWAAEARRVVGDAGRRKGEA